MDEFPNRRSPSPPGKGSRAAISWSLSPAYQRPRRGADPKPSREKALFLSGCETRPATFAPAGSSRSASVSGKNMADILALDADGCVVIVEIKRDWSDRATVGQLLEYAAAMTGKNYEDLEKLDRNYWPRHHGTVRTSP